MARLSLWARLFPNLFQVKTLDLLLWSKLLFRWGTRDIRVSPLLFWRQIPSLKPIISNPSQRNLIEKDLILSIDLRRVLMIAFLPVFNTVLRIIEQVIECQSNCLLILTRDCRTCSSFLWTLQNNLLNGRRLALIFYFFTTPAVDPRSNGSIVIGLDFVQLLELSKDKSI